MITKYYDLKKINKNDLDYFLFYGPNIGLIEETINNTLKPIFSSNIYNYDEVEILNNTSNFHADVLNKSFFENDKLIIINRVTDKIYEIIKKIIEDKTEDIKIILKAGNLEKKSKIRNFFEKQKNLIITAFYEDTYQALFQITQNFLRERKINISNEIINLIIERSRNNRINLTNELEKVSLLYFKKNKTVNLKDIQKLTNLVENYNYSEVVDCYLLKNKKKTIYILNENNLNVEDDILILKSFLFKLKRLKSLKKKLEENINIEEVLNTFKPAIFWKEKEIVKQQLKIRSLSNINMLLKKINNLELLIKKNSQISRQIVNDFILENSNSLI
jgi:DNA polymerase-3 subunit delta